MSDVTETQNNYPVHPAFDEVVEKNLQTIEELRSVHYKQGNGEKIRLLFQECIAHIDQNAVRELHLLEEGTHYRARDASSSAYAGAEKILLRYSQDFENPQFSPREFLIHYADGVQNYLNGGCPPQESGNSFMPEEGANKGETGCPALRRADQDIKNLVENGFVDQGGVAQSSPNYAFFGGGFSVNHLQRFQELDSYRTYYSYFFVDGGYLRKLGRKWPEFVQGTGPLIEGGFSYVGGDDANLGSHRYEFEVRGGWEQHFLKHFFITPKGGIGLALNWLDFGKGFPLEEETSLMGQIRVLAGGDIPVGASSFISVSLGYFYEGTLAGEPAYENHGPLLRVGLKSNKLSRTPPLRTPPEEKR